MKRSAIFVLLLSVSVWCFAQNNNGILVIGRIPDATDSQLYQIQVGAFKITQNAENALGKLIAASLNPSYETYRDFTRVMIKGISARDVPSSIEKIKRAGFFEVFIKIDSGGAAAARLPVSTAALPSTALHEIAYRSVKVGETRSLADIVSDKNVVLWKSSTPSTVSVDSNGIITGLKIGNGYISINETEYISVVVVPTEDFYILPESEAASLSRDSRVSESSTGNITEYSTEPTFRLAYRFNNKGERRGASGRNGGVDILGRGPDYEWLWTTYKQGGWFYDLNGIKREMINGYQKDPHNGVELTVKPEFVYDKGVSYLQLKHILRNSGNSAVTGQKFGASADVMIHKNDNAPLLRTSYGAYMTDSETNPALELMFVCESGNGIDPVDTLWLGEYGDGAHLEHIYDDNRSDVRDVDSAIGFSYQNIDLAPGQVKEFIVRFTLARTEN
ncbi:MAG: hypothetical protein LBH20_03285 [Treponema sp.]|jgi:hypothetical protein|nr:hypothetical protein [Treponema sp.]